MAKFYAVDANGNSALLSIPMQGFTQSLQQDGWCKLPNGLILQWSGPSKRTYSDQWLWSIRISSVFCLNSSSWGETYSFNYDKWNNITEDGCYWAYRNPNAVPVSETSFLFMIGV